MEDKFLKIVFFTVFFSLDIFFGLTQNSCAFAKENSLEKIEEQKNSEVSSPENSDFPSIESLKKNYSAISLSNFSDSINHARYGFKNSLPPYEIYDETQIAGISENLIWLQNPDGGWSKNWDWARVYSESELRELKKSHEKIPATLWRLPKSVHKMASTTDNRNVYTQLEYLSKVFLQIPDEKYALCAERALDFLLSAQHQKTGGFTGADVLAVTFNDDVMSGILSALREVATNDELYGYLPAKKRTAAKNAYKKGIDCILKTQICVKDKNGKVSLSAWCQQYDYETLNPIWARTFEPPAIATAESVKVVRFLMQEENPSKKIKNAIIAACEWLDRDEIRIHGKILVRIPAEEATLNGKWSDFEQVLKDDDAAPDIWARFYDIETQKPLWCDRERVFCENFNDLSRERRNGYAYTGKQPASLLEKDFPEWKARTKIEK